MPIEETSAMSRFEEQITVDVPVRIAYDHWTHFEAFPSFMDGVERVEQLDDKTLRWTVSVSGVSRTWIAEIVDQTPDTRIAWKSVEGVENAGAVLFEATGPGQTRVTLRIDTAPDGVVETVGDALGFLQRRVKGDLERYKEWVEQGGAGVDGWRGEIHGDEVRPDPAEATTPSITRRW
jgi:uncharacterized membrane protein